MSESKLLQRAVVYANLRERGELALRRSSIIRPLASCAVIQETGPSYQETRALGVVRG
jgi:hypothetical protein